jgi:Protein of unknown function (DUF2656)
MASIFSSGFWLFIWIRSIDLIQNPLNVQFGSSKPLPPLNFMTESNLGRMLLSHNFNISPDILPVLSRTEFTAIFAAGLDKQIQCQILDNPHWIVEILFPANVFSPQQIGQLCAQALASQRQPVGKVDILILGGLKTTPPTSDSPAALQPGDWGVDVVETSDGAEFLRSIDWDKMIADKPTENIFRVEVQV